MHLHSCFLLPFKTHHYVVSLWFSSLCHHSGMPPATFLARYISSGKKGRFATSVFHHLKAKICRGPTCTEHPQTCVTLCLFRGEVLAFHRRQRSCDWDPLAGFGGPTSRSAADGWGGDELSGPARLWFLDLQRSSGPRLFGNAGE